MTNMTATVDLLPPTFTYSEALTAGLTKHRIYAVRDAGLIEAIARGLYRRSNVDELVDPDYLEIARRARRATLCLTTALVHHELTEANPAAIDVADVALPSGSHRPLLSTPITWHLFDRSTFGIGRSTLPLSLNTSIGLYSRRGVSSMRFGYAIARVTTLLI